MTTGAKYIIPEEKGGVVTRTFHIKNFERLQHYKDRSPPWIKLYNGLLENYEFASLPDATKGNYIDDSLAR